MGDQADGKDDSSGASRAELGHLCMCTWLPRSWHEVGALHPHPLQYECLWNMSRFCEVQLTAGPEIDRNELPPQMCIEGHFRIGEHTPLLQAISANAVKRLRRSPGEFGLVCLANFVWAYAMLLLPEPALFSGAAKVARRPLP